eukprot:scaffold17442_cov99-Isochrysis_galbana.AAC.3
MAHTADLPNPQRYSLPHPPPFRYPPLATAAHTLVILSPHGILSLAPPPQQYLSLTLPSFPVSTSSPCPAGASTGSAPSPNGIPPSHPPSSGIHSQPRPTRL